jgi:hypothetical protein
MRINPSRVHLERFVRQSAEAIEPGSRILDAGAENVCKRKGSDWRAAVALIAVESLYLL